MTRCEDKKRFRDRISAMLALERVHLQGEDRGKYPTRVYRCPICKGWHMTSQPKKGGRA